MKLSPFTTWIDGRWQVSKERIIKTSSGEARIQLLRVHAYQMRYEAIKDELPCEQCRVHAPKRKKGLNAGAAEKLFPVQTHVAEKEIAKSNVIHTRMLATS